MIEWKSYSPDNFGVDWDRVFIMQTDFYDNECAIYYGDEYCVINGFSIEELFDKFKDWGCDVPNSSKTEVKTAIEKILKEN